MKILYDFEKGIEVPAAAARSGVNIDLLRAMPVGVSIWFSTKDAKKVTRFYRVAKKLGVTILIRKVGREDPKGTGVRMWKMANGGKKSLDPIAAAERAARPVRAKAKKRKPKTPAKPPRKVAKVAGNGAAPKRKAKRRTRKVKVSGVQAAGQTAAAAIETADQ
jgi:hypothetical protein